MPANGMASSSEKLMGGYITHPPPLRWRGLKDKDSAYVMVRNSGWIANNDISIELGRFYLDCAAPQVSGLEMRMVSVFSVRVTYYVSTVRHA